MLFLRCLLFVLALLCMSEVSMEISDFGTLIWGFNSFIGHPGDSVFRVQCSEVVGVSHRRNYGLQATQAKAMKKHHKPKTMGTGKNGQNRIPLRSSGTAQSYVDPKFAKPPKAH